MPAVHTRPLRDRDPLFTGNMGTELATFRRVGPFDESPSLAGAEDNDWGYRALQLGVPIVYAPEVAVTHLDWRDTRELAVVYRRYARAQGGFYGKHLRGATCSSPGAPSATCCAVRGCCCGRRPPGTASSRCSDRRRCVASRQASSRVSGARRP